MFKQAARKSSAAAPSTVDLFDKIFMFCNFTIQHVSPFSSVKYVTQQLQEEPLKRGAFVSLCSSLLSLSHFAATFITSLGMRCYENLLNKERKKKGEVEQHCPGCNPGFLKHWHLCNEIMPLSSRNNNQNIGAGSPVSHCFESCTTKKNMFSA